MSIPVAKQVYGQEEIDLITEVARSGKWAEGEMAARFSKKLQEFMNLRKSILCNSGSSANLLALTALTSPRLGDLRLRPGDKVITGATSFPTTVAPIVQNHLIPVYLDADQDTANIKAGDIAQAIDEWKPRAVMVTHTLGNPCEMDLIEKMCVERGIWLLEDNCDALGAMYRGRKTGSFGHLSTQSFYPAHHISCGEGGAVGTASAKLARIVESFRNWGRDCWCDPGKDNTCGKRFGHQFEGLPFGYDHKYAITHLGYNLKITDLQAAAGVAQMDKLPGFVNARRANHYFLRTQMSDLQIDGTFRFQKELPEAEASWFGFLMTVETDRFSRGDLVNYLESHGIATRALFGGNITRQPAFAELPYISAPLPNSDRIMERSLWIGCWPGLTFVQMSYIVDTIRGFLE